MNALVGSRISIDLALAVLRDRANLISSEGHANRFRCGGIRLVPRVWREVRPCALRIYICSFIFTLYRRLLPMRRCLLAIPPIILITEEYLPVFCVSCLWF